MTYPGNAALSSETKKRLLATFEQTLKLAQRGNHQEALLGCDFILRMDPLFEPARTLLERLNRGGDLNLADLGAAPAAASPPPAPGSAGSSRPPAAPPSPVAPPSPPSPIVPPTPHPERDELSFADLDDLAPQVAPTAVPPAAAVASSLRAALEDAVAERRFQDVLALAEADRPALAADPALRRLTEEAQSALEAEPYVRRFLNGAREALDAGRLDECERLLEKARALDGTHPEIGVLDQRRAEAQGAASPLGWARGAAPPAAAPPEPALELEESLGELRLEDAEGLPSGLSLSEPPPPLEEQDVPASRMLGQPAPQPLPPPAAPAPPPPQPVALEPPLQAAAPEPPPAAPATAAAAGPAPLEPVPVLAPELSLELPALELETPSGADGEDPRIAQLLAEGQAAFERGEHQSAVDAWSRIFLIDIDHAEAARRIERARNLKAEAERKLEEIFHDGLAQVEAGETEAARANFARLLELQPNHLAAREQLQLIESGQARPAAGRETGAPAAGPAPLKEEILIPPEPGAARPAVVEPLPQVAASSRGRTFLAIGGAVLVLALAGGWLLWSNRERLFPNSRAAAPPAPAVAEDPIARATRLHEEGKTAIAVSQLRRLPPNDPQYDRAQALIAQWESLEPPPPPPASGPAPADLERRDALVERARDAQARGEFRRAMTFYEQAAAAAPLDPEAAARAESARRAIEPLQHQIELFQQGEWEYVLPALWRLREEQPDNRDVVQLIIDAYHNLGVRDLQREDPVGAAEKFREALLLAGEDSDLQRLSLFAQTYSERPQDLLYRTFVKYVPFR